MKVKTCTKCKSTFDLSLFNKQKQTADGLNSHCNLCRAKAQKLRRAANPEKYLAKARNYRENNLEKCRELCRDHYKRNKPMYLAKWAKRKAAKIQAVPSWVGEEELFVINEIYSLAKKRSILTNIVWHVDHIVPLQGINVCGLHCPDNLQVITATENLTKSNKLKENIYE